MVEEAIEGTSYTWVKNPNYWGHDEDHPENQLPYIDRFRLLEITDFATQKAAFRTGQIDDLGGFYLHVNVLPKQADEILRSNPETQWRTKAGEAWTIGMSFNWDMETAGGKPWGDIRVRQALQMAINREEIAEEYYRGYVTPDPYPLWGSRVKGFYTPFEDWPEETKKYYRYDPEAARQLLAEAGYPDGFKVDLWIGEGQQDPELAQLLKSYFADIGVDMTIVQYEWGDYWAHLLKWELTDWNQDWAATQSAPGPRLTCCFVTRSGGSRQQWDDPFVNRNTELMLAATDYNEYQRIAKEIDAYFRDKFLRIISPSMAQEAMWHPWVKNYNGEMFLGQENAGGIYARIWHDQDKKKQMEF